MRDEEQHENKEDHSYLTKSIKTRISVLNQKIKVIKDRRNTRLALNRVPSSILLMLALLRAAPAVGFTD